MENGAYERPVFASSPNGGKSWTVTSMLHVSFSTLLPSLWLWLLTSWLRGSLRAAERIAASQVINARQS